MKYDNSHNSMREYITYDFSSKYATSTVFADAEVVHNIDAERRENENLHIKHFVPHIDLWRDYE